MQEFVQAMFQDFTLTKLMVDANYFLTVDVGVTVTILKPLMNVLLIVVDPVRMYF